MSDTKYRLLHRAFVIPFNGIFQDRVVQTENVKQYLVKTRILGV